MITAIESTAAALAGTTQALKRQAAIRDVDRILARGECSIAELEAMKPLVQGYASRVLEDVIGCAFHPNGNPFGMLASFRGTLIRRE